MKFIYKRILFKISGEVIKNINNKKFQNSIIFNIIKDIKYLIKHGIEISIIIGGGNLFRGSELTKIGINRITADYIGILSTVINGLFLKDLFNKYNISVCLMSSNIVNDVCEKYNLEKAINLLSNSVVVIFCGGFGYPFFTTDSAACLRAIETCSDIILKGTQVNGVYSKDPKNYKNAILYDKLNYQDVLKNEFKIMDLTAFILARDHNIPICIFNIYNKKALIRILFGEKEGTIIHNNI
ncbi:UMP kinase [Buchnera aphidicola]|uniref:Uridylate kinase n=1 Tax=Buchnera aphidicola (Therioaphis trifolii) TaxID=1241884 RepID=A0A4D6YD28_9GAMM|nr:UMP kinase [Buchnera aphidicola]QCI27159.1 UMP kinase [Buchnera aphidicola (Therioaphis trifolii)]